MKEINRENHSRVSGCLKHMCWKSFIRCLYIYYKL